MRRSVTALVAVLLAAPAAARVVSYAPVTSRFAAPVQQPRASADFVLIEAAAGVWTGGGPVADPLPWYSGFPGRLVVHDATGAREPRVVLPTAGEEAAFYAAAARPGPDGALRIVTLTTADPTGLLPRDRVRVLFSRDGGASWKDLDLPSGLTATTPTDWLSAMRGPDLGGPVARGRDRVLRLGSDASPFVLVLSGTAGDGSGALVAVDDGGALRVLAEVSKPEEDGSGGARLVGTSRDGGAILVAGRIQPPGTAGPAKPPQALWKVGTAGGLEKVLDLSPSVPALEGWITSSGAYVEVAWWGAIVAVPAPFRSARALYFVSGGVATEVAASTAVTTDWTTLLVSFFAIPTADFEGAWVLRRGPGKPTVLAKHAPSTGLVEKWSDPTAPEVEGLHAGASGRKLLVQVHRPRPQMDARLFKDPALALWEEGQPAPRAYDELFLDEQTNKGFVHLDVEAVADGAPFVFDSGSVPSYCCVAGGPSGDGGAGGADVVQEWGVVKGSLRQRLVIPAVARSAGFGGAFWKSDLLVRNPGSDPLRVDLRFVPGGGGPAREASLALGPLEIRVVPDVLATLFSVPDGAGALFLSPGGTRVVAATSRTYTAAAEGAFGMSLAAFDLFASSSARFPHSFAGALPGAGYRTNVAGVDVAGRGAEVSLRAAAESGWAGRPDLLFQAPPGGSTQLNGLASLLGVEPWRSGALEYAPTRGEVVPFVVSIDGTTNDPTAWRPDLPASAMRAIPALVHADGRNGARFRSDLFLYNDTDAPTSVTLAAKPWDSARNETIVTLTLLPREGKVVRDALAAVFRQEGVARLRFVSPEAGAGTGVRVTSRAYTVRPDGGTFGVPLPPLNSFQMAGAGESIELFGVLGGPGFRTNLSLVEMTPFADGKNVRARVEVIGDGGTTLDSFDVNVPVAGGIQVDDLFRSRGLGDGPAAALVRISPAGGLVAAYATSLDQGTNDAILVPAALASRD